MSASSLDQILAQVKELTPEEQEKVRELLASLAEEVSSEKNAVDPSAPLATEEEDEQILVARGIIRRVPSRLPNPRLQDFKPLEIEGKPLSEIILEERR